jgi:hypothetical protein
VTTSYVPRPALAVRPLPTILRIAEQGITVADFASMELWSVPAEADARQTLEEMRQHDFDVAPIADEQIWRFADIPSLEAARGIVGDAARPIRATEVAPHTLGLLDTVEALRHTPRLFVLRGTRVVGLVTRADIQRQAVSMAALALVLAAEQGLLELIRCRSGNTWQDRLTEPRLAKANGILQERLRHNTAIDLLQCLGLEDLMRIVRGDGPLGAELGYTPKHLKTWADRLRSTRDNLAHAGTLLGAEPDPIQAIQLFVEIQGFAERVWQCVDHRAPEPAVGSSLPTASP